MSLKPKVALSQDFLLNLARLPAAVQGKVLKWAIRFQTDPTASGFNYEKIQGARDPHVKSVRIDGDWRGIVFVPPRSDLYILLYVDHHDAAYRWAERRKLTINPVTGAMQVVLLEEVSAPGEPAAIATRPLTSDAIARQPLFDRLSDTDLLSLGTPTDMLARVRQISSEAELDALQPVLPIEAYEGLFLVAARDTVSQVLSARETQVNRPIDTEDFAGSVQTAESQSRFVVVDDDEALTAIMNAPLAQWRVFLHPMQKKLAIGDRSGPVRILGGAGTGKTVLAMHRAKWLAEHATPGGKKVLVTTFTRNLAIDLEANLSTLCTQDVMNRIEVRNLDSWVLRFLRSKRYEQSIVYGRQDEAAECWNRALAVKDASLGLDDEFYAAELEQVVLAQGVATLDAYRAARRVGRGVVLSRAKRDAVWPVFEEYRAQLASRRLKEVDDAYRDAAQLIAQDKYYPYSAIVVDETQDFGPQALRLLRALIEPGKNDLFFVGDGHQRIYPRHKAAMSRSGIDIRGRARKLYINYRTTDEIRRQAVALLEGVEVDDLDEGTDNNARYKSLSHGPAPTMESCLSQEDLVTRVQAILADWGVVPDAVNLGATCIMAASRSARDQLMSAIRSAGYAVESIEADTRAKTKGNCLLFATMHRAKGLEFQNVIVTRTTVGKGDRGEAAPQLIYVALTRAKQRAARLTAI
ncbi:MAG: UvrD-helicase domain-containing protein [Candidatus Entotheonellia bacterium]